MKQILTIFLLLCTLQTYAQDLEILSFKKYELGLNVTGTFAGFFNAEGIKDGIDPYLLSLKLIKNKNVVRIGLAASLQNSNETDPNTFNQREIKESTTRLRVGFERRELIGKRFMYHWGLDVIGEYAVDNVNTFGQFGLVSLKNKAIGVGLGPVCGFSYILHPRVTLSTESSFYAVQRFIKESQNIPPAVPSTFNNRNFRFLPILPSSLYLNFRF
jgi:hypothetical protein